MLNTLRFISALTLPIVLLSACIGAGDSPTPTSESVASTATRESVAPTPTTAPPEPTAAPVGLAGTRWLLTAIDGDPAPEGRTVTLSFTPAQVGGIIADCAVYGGAYTSSDDAFSVAEVISNAERCRQQLIDVDLADEYYTALEATVAYRMLENRLELARADGSTALAYIADERAPLAGTTWSLFEIDGDRDPDKTNVSIEFSGNRISGTAICHRYAGLYQATRDGGFSASELVLNEQALPKKRCDDFQELSDEARAFVDALAETASFWVDRQIGLLELRDAGGNVWATFRSGSAVDFNLLDGTAWILTDLAGTEPAADQPTTLLFATAALGGAGCLAFRTNFKAAPDGAIYIPDLVWQDTPCSETGLAAKAYRAAFESVTYYSLSSDSLVLLNADGAAVLTYRSGLLEDDPLEQTAWTLVSMRDMALVEGNPITITFENGHAGGSSGCNRYGSRYVMAESEIIAFHDGIMTLIGCFGAIEQQEGTYHGALDAVVGYRITDTRLELLDADGAVLLVFERDNP